MRMNEDSKTMWVIFQILSNWDMIDLAPRIVQNLRRQPQGVMTAHEIWKDRW